MGCNSSRLEASEPQVSSKSRRSSNQYGELSEIQKNIQKLLNQQISHSRPKTFATKSAQSSQRNSRVSERLPEMSLSTILQPTDTLIRPLQRKSIQ